MVNVRKTATGQGRGFTLLELLVVLTLAGLLLSLVPPVISAAVPGARLKLATREFVSTLKQTRSLAITQGAAADIIVTTAPPQYTVAGGKLTTLPADTELQISGAAFVAVTQMSTFADISPDDKFTLRFYPDGSASGGEIKFMRGQSAYVVDIDWLTGQISAKRATGDVYR